jgi:uncharacterized membrane protein
MYVAQRIQYMAEQYELKELGDHVKERIPLMQSLYEQAQQSIQNDGRKSGESVKF